MADPRSLLPVDRKAGVTRSVIEKRLSHKKSFNISDVNIKFKLAKCAKIVS